MLKTALIGIIFSHSKETLFNTYSYGLIEILIVTSASSSFQLTVLNLKLSALTEHFFLSQHLGDSGITHFMALSLYIYIILGIQRPVSRTALYFFVIKNIFPFSTSPRNVIILSC